MHSECPSSDGTPRFISFWQWFLHGSRTWSMQVIGAGDWCWWFIKTIQVQIIYRVDHMNALWVPAQWWNTTFHKLLAMVLHGPRTWSRLMIDTGVWCRRFIKTVQVQMIHKIDRINVLWVTAQASNTTFYKLFAMVFTRFTHMVDADDWCGCLM